MSHKEIVCPLGSSINLATRPLHTELNKLITHHLPLALPPQTEDPSNYVSGLLHITHIYSTFEALWRSALDLPIAPANNGVQEEHSCEVCKPTATIHQAADTAGAASAQPKICSRIHALLERMYSAELERELALKSDIAALTGWAPDLLEEQLKTTSEHPVLSAFVTHIQQASKARPHILIAYAWVLYMALFKGGQVMRATLAQVDSSFWSATNPDIYPEKPLEFLTFEDDELKVDFKRRLVEATEVDNLLTAEEKEDIVGEAQRIFQFMMDIVEELDQVCSNDHNDVESIAERFKGLVGRLLGFRQRDSIVVTHERQAMAKSTEKSQRVHTEVTEDDAGVAS